MYAFSVIPRSELTYPQDLDVAQIDEILHSIVGGEVSLLDFGE